jgi:hypothetical protein
VNTNLISSRRPTLFNTQPSHDFLHHKFYTHPHHEKQKEEEEETYPNLGAALGANAEALARVAAMMASFIIVII